jgi:hypothetical protein
MFYVYEPLFNSIMRYKKTFLGGKSKIIVNYLVTGDNKCTLTFIFTISMGCNSYNLGGN